MNTVRENFILFFLALIAVIAIIIALSLQLTIISNQGSTTENGQSGTNSSRNNTGAIVIIATATREPASLTMAQPTLALPTPVPPTPIPTVTVAPAVLPPTKPESDTIVSDMSTVETRNTQPIPTMTLSPIPIASAVDLRLGYIERDIANCNFFTQILKQVLEQEAGLEIGIVEFRDTDALYAQLASTEERRPVDLTLCFTDPDDRDYIHKYFGYTKLIGSAYWQNDTSRLQIIANASMVAQLRKSQPCLYNLLQNLNFDDLTTENMLIDQWLSENPQPLQTWVRCDLN